MHLRHHICKKKLCCKIDTLVFILLAGYDHSNVVGYTLPTAEILSGKNARAFLVCGFLMKSFKKNPENMKKIVGAVRKLPAK